MIDKGPISHSLNSTTAFLIIQDCIHGVMIHKGSISHSWNYTTAFLLKNNGKLEIEIFDRLHHANMTVQYRPPYTPLLYGKTGAYRGIIFFFNFCSKT